jgi:TRAP transporter TAXI family solute receptor
MPQEIVPSSVKNLQAHNHRDSQYSFVSRNLTLIGLGIVSVGLAVAGLWGIFAQNKVHRVTIAAGAKEGESYIISQALEQVVERYHNNIEITVKETQGTSENIKLLESKEAHLGALQADVAAGPSARLIAILYPDHFQLLVHPDSGVKNFSDLKGKRIALPKKGGQFRSFLDVATHFGLQEKDFQFVGDDEQIANNFFKSKQADVLFRVRALGSPAIAEIVQITQSQFIPIPQAEAMQLKYPVFNAAIIPEGAYRGNPPLPPQNLPSVSVNRLFVSRYDLDPQVVQSITQVMLERRQEIAEAIPHSARAVKPLVASIQSPLEVKRSGLQVHPGALAYYNRDEPSFLQENADYVALILTVILLIGSWFWELKKMLERRQKANADLYSSRVIELMQSMPENASYQLLEYGLGEIAECEIASFVKSPVTAQH